MSIKRLTFLLCGFLLSCPCAGAASESDSVSLPGEGGTLPAVEYPYFPDRQHAFVWRNWTSVPAARLAEVLATSEENVNRLAASMGLRPQRGIEPYWSDARGYITVLRRNWHLLPYDQLLTLLGLTREELAWRLIEDDFLFVKLGNVKPACEPLRYRAPDERAMRGAARIDSLLGTFGREAFAREDRRFWFLVVFGRAGPVTGAGRTETESPEERFDLRLIFSYFAAYGDPLTDPDLSSYPEGLLQRLSEKGINGIWIHSVLRTLVEPDGIFPGADDASRRIEGLRRLVERAARYGIGVYLYVNEPRAMPGSFFEADARRRSLSGTAEGDLRTLCTSLPEVRSWLSRSLESVFRQVPGLAGVFSITASENLTNCVSHGNRAGCSRCAGRSYAELIAEVNTAISEGVLAGNPEARVLVWDWGWDDSQAREIIRRLPKSCWLMSVSEWALPIERGGVASAVGEYSLSAVGPGPRAMAHWRYAKEAGLKTVAKVQVNASWEMAVVPALPVLDLVARHAGNLAAASTDGVMLSWSLGGYPSANLELFQSHGDGDSEAALRQLAEKYYGKRAAPEVRRAWKAFSDAFEQFPYHGLTLYSGPQHMGPANPLYLEPTGYRASMVGIPYDALDDWRSVYPAETFVRQMEKVAEGFACGCEALRSAVALASGEKRLALKRELGRAEAVRIHCASSAAQARFTMERDRFLASSDRDEKLLCLERMRRAAESEAAHARELLPLVKADPVIGYESSNHYFYVPQDLLEKQINVRFVLDGIEEQRRNLSH